MVLVTTTSNLSTECRTFEVRPNRSLSRKGMIVFFLAVAALTLLVTVRFLLLGAWVILPFALLEIAVLGVSLYLFERASRYSETIQIAPDSILITTRSGVDILREYRLQPYWVNIALQRDPHHWYPSKLLLRSHGECIEIGACLTNADRKTLANTITNALESCRKTTH